MREWRVAIRERSLGLALPADVEDFGNVIDIVALIPRRNPPIHYLYLDPKYRSTATYIPTSAARGALVLVVPRGHFPNGRLTRRPVLYMQMEVAIVSPEFAPEFCLRNSSKVFCLPARKLEPSARDVPLPRPRHLAPSNLHLHLELENQCIRALWHTQRIRIARPFRPPPNMGAAAPAGCFAVQEHCTYISTLLPMARSAMLTHFSFIRTRNILAGSRGGYGGLESEDFANQRSRTMRACSTLLPCQITRVALGSMDVHVLFSPLASDGCEELCDLRQCTLRARTRFFFFLGILRILCPASVL